MSAVCAWCTNGSQRGVSHGLCPSCATRLEGGKVVEFWETGYGRKFFGADLPRLIKALERIAEKLPDAPADAALVTKIEELRRMPTPALRDTAWYVGYTDALKHVVELMTTPKP